MLLHVPLERLNRRSAYTSHSHLFAAYLREAAPVIEIQEE